MTITAALIAEERDVRIHTALRIQIDRDAMYALRGALATDEDAEVRSVCAERLGNASVTRVRGRVATAVRIALIDALDDESPMVRERAVASLARHFETDLDDAFVANVIVKLREMARREPVWRVRRAAVRAVANVDKGAIDVLVDVLDDPFWRVRYAAIQALRERSTSECARAIESAPRAARRDAALAYLRATSGDEPAETDRAELPREDDALADEDPAVVAVEIAKVSDDALNATRLVSFLQSPHDVLRRAASKRLLARSRDDDVVAAIALLDDPRVPYVDDAVRRLLARASTRDARERILRDGGPPTALAWTITECARRGDVDFALDVFFTRSSVIVRRAAVMSANEEAPIASLGAALEDSDDDVRAFAAGALAQRADGVDALDAHDFSREPPRVLRAAVSGELAPHAVLAAAVGGVDPAARARAIATLRHRGELDDTLRASSLVDEDPWIRAAALDAHDDAMNALRSDPDPSTRRAAFEHVASNGDAIAIAAHGDDAWLRMRAAESVRPRRGHDETGPRRGHDETGPRGGHDETLSIDVILRLTRDRIAMVRSAAAEALARRDATEACFEIVARDPPVDEALRLAAHGRLVMEGSQRAFDALERDLSALELSAETRWSLLGMTLAYPDELRRGSVHIYEPREIATRAIDETAIGKGERRMLGATDVAMSPLVVSGAFDLQPAWLARARERGVNSFFWEPEYRALAAFIAGAPRKEDLVIVCGTYEADRKTIERDVERALRRLRIDSLGVMLLFWVRSPARLSDEAFGALENLKRSGKVRAIGFSTHLRELAARAVTERAWDVVMTRHSAAHTALETTLLPVARAKNVGIITFSALVYGRMLSARTSIDAADCYRYSLAQPGVTACITAPRRQRELEQNLAVMRTSALSGETAAHLREHGRHVREENRAFMNLVRRR